MIASIVKSDVFEMRLIFYVEPVEFSDNWCGSIFLQHPKYVEAYPVGSFK